MEDFSLLPPKGSRQSQIEALDIGDTISISRRVELRYGFPEGAINKHTQQLRGTADGQTNKARRRLKDRKFKVENGSFITSDGSLIIVAAVTRTE